MKNKPLRHKESNTFKFQPFSERISNINIDVFHRVKHQYEDESEEDTFFFQTLEKWIVLNCSQSFAELEKELTKDVKTLPQILALKQHIVDVLLKHLDAKNQLNLQAVLELVVALAKDLRQEFYPYYEVFLQKLISLLETKDTDQLEWTFQCLAYLFKFLWRPLVNNLPTVFDSLLPLLSSSKPFYINNFAAESFAFVARKVKDQSKFIKLILRALKKFPDGVPGCGRLLFEVVRGVPGQLHSCAEGMLTLLFQSLSDDKFAHSLLCELLETTVHLLVSNVQPKHSTLIWKILQNSVEQYHSQWKTDKNEKQANNVLQGLKYIHQAVEHKKGSLVILPEELVKVLLKLLEPEDQVNSEVTELDAEILTLLLLSPVLHLTQELASKIINFTLENLKEEALIGFIKGILGYVSFEGLVLPHLLMFCMTKEPASLIPLLSELILTKVPPAQTAQDLLQWTPYNLDFGICKEGDLLKYSNFIFDVLSEPAINSYIQNIEKVTCALIILPHIIPMSKTTAISKVSNLISTLFREIKSDPTKEEPLETEETSKLTVNLNLLCTALECLIHLKPECFSKLVEPREILDVLLPYATQPNYLSALRSLGFYIAFDEINAMTPFASEIREKILVNLLSPFHKVRLLSTHLLYDLEKANVKANPKMLQILENCWKAEKTPVDLQHYRDKLKYLQKLDCNETMICAIQRDSIDPKIPLTYLLGVLYVNFKLVWEPVIKLIVSYAQSMKPNEFWSTFGPQVCSIADIIRGKEINVNVDVYFKHECLNDAYTHLNTLEDKPDHINYRILLWKTLEEIPEICELKNRDLSQEFLTFLEEEYFKRNAEQAKTWDIKLKKDETKCTDEADLESSDEESDDNDIKKSLNESIPDLDAKFRLTTKSLLAHLKVFGKLRNPKAIYREPELNTVYHDFLSHKLADVQKAALDCLMTYKHKFLTPYKNNLYALIDDKTFKTEIVLFRVDTQSELIRPEHRSDLIPIVLRIVYSKMHGHGSGKSARSVKGNRHPRRAIVIRFLAGCSGDELEHFFHMSFRLFHDKITDDILSTVDHTISTLDLKSVIPPKRLFSSINLANTLLVYCGGLLSNELLAYLLKIVMTHGAIAMGILLAKEDIHPGYIKTVRNVRTACFGVISKFYERFQLYPWTAKEIDSVFKVFVWPWLKKLPVEGVLSPSPLLKLFVMWSQNPRYFSLLGKFHEEDENLSPLRIIIDLWLNPKLHGSVWSTVMELVERLLTLQCEENSMDDGSELTVKNKAIVEESRLKELRVSEELNYGSLLLLPYISNVVEILKCKLLSGKRQNLMKRDLEVLSRITELVSEPESSQTVLNLLLPIILKKAGSSEYIISPLLTTANNLMRNIIDPASYVRSFAPLFGSVVGPGPRKLLSSFIVNLSQQTKFESSLDAALLDDLNSWDAKWIDQPDFTRRLDAFKKLEALTLENKISVDMGIIVIYTCFHFLKMEKDPSLRENASYCLKKLCPALCLANKDDAVTRNFLVNEVMLNILSNGIKDRSNDVIRDESIAILGCMARECSELHPVLQDLSLLGNQGDLEVDFFENLRHLQLHRKVRAMLKFCEVAKGLNKPPCSRTLTQFVLPLVCHYLCSVKFSNKNTIVDAAIQAVGTSCRLLPWHQYLTVLKYYLGKFQGSIEFQKQLVRVNVEILNAFHFDLSQASHSKVALEEKDLEVTESKEMEVDQSNESVDNGKMGEEAVAEEPKEEAENDEEDNFETKENIEEEDEELTVPVGVKAFEIETVLSRSGAIRMTQTITRTLLPQLNKSMAQRTQADTTHRLNRKLMGPDRDEEDILRVPLAIAVVKLLQRLPAGILDRNLPGIIMKLCTFLKSRMESVRKVTRETLQTIMVSIGPSYLRTVIQEMTSLLTRGFHVHVLVYSIHSLLVAVKPQFKQGDIDDCVHSLLSVCVMDLFGDAAEEKEVVQIAGKVMEARANRSYDIFHILAENASEKYLLDLIFPLKNELSRTLSHKNVTKASECLQQVVLGLIDNKHISVESLLQFSYGTASESIPSLVKLLKDKPVDAKLMEFQSRKQPDSYLIPEEPKRQKAGLMKTCARTNAHILVEFGLRLLYFLLKREKLKDRYYLPHLDPLVNVMSDCLKSQHVKVCTIAIQCLCWLMKFELPAMHQNIGSFSSMLFSILHKYAAAGLSKGDNFDLVRAAFKAVAVLVREIKYHKLEQDQMHALLLYCEQDLDDYSRQATAFSLLKAIVGQKTDAPQLFDIMDKVANLSVTANVDSVKLQARQVIIQFLMEYPLGKKLDSYLAFYFRQLSYDSQPGRESTLEMLRTIVNTFPVDVLEDQSGVIFLNVGASLVNDNAPECRKQASEIISLMLSRIDNNAKTKLFNIAILWLKENKVAHRRLAAQVIGIFITVEKENFISRIDSVLSLVISQLDQGSRKSKPGRFVLLSNDAPEEEITDDKGRIQDHHLYQVLQMLVKLCTLCPKFLTESRFTESIESIADNAHALLAHSHEWVRFGSAQLLGIILNSISTSEIAIAANNPKCEKVGYLLNNTTFRLKSLALDLSSQLTPSENLNDKFLMQCMKLLVYIAEVLKDIKEEGQDTLSLLWLVRRIRKLINTEVVQSPSSTIVRTMSFNWIAALALKLEKETLSPIAPSLLTPLVREINSTDNANSTLKQVAKEAAGYVKKKIGPDEYNTVVAKLTEMLEIKRSERKKQRAQLMVTDPAKAAKRKINKQLKKRVLKKRKVELIKGHKFRRKPRREEIDLEDV